MPGPGGPGGGRRPGGFGGPRGGHFGGHRPPPPMGGGWGHRPPPRGRGCCGCFMPMMAFALAAIAGICMFLF